MSSGTYFRVYAEKRSIMNLRHLLKNGCKPKISIEEGFKELAAQTNQRRLEAADLFDKVMRKPEERNLA